MTPDQAAAAMDEALRLARAQLGRTAPNPAVGCLLANAEGWIAGAATADGGRPHAERQAIDAAGYRARGATAFVTLEPCAHYGETPPCADALIEAGIAAVQIACLDPDPRTAGQGAARLEAAGLTVEIGLKQAEAEIVNAGFFKRLRTGLPWVALASDGRGFDAELTLAAAEDPLERLRAMGAQGLTRIVAHPDGETARRLRAAGLVDEG